MTKSDYFNKPFLIELFKKALPLIFGVILFNLITLIDNYMIGIMQPDGGHELAVTSIGTKYTKIGVQVVIAVLAMFSFMVPQLKGSKNYEKIKEVFKIMFLFVLITSGLLIVIAFLETDNILKFFQGDNYETDSSTISGDAQSYMKFSIFIILTTGLFQLFLISITAWGYQKIIIYEVIVVLFTNILFNYLFYKVAKMGLNGIILSSLISEIITLLIFVWWLFYKKIAKYVLFNPFKLFVLDLQLLINGFKRWGMAFQTILWGLISIGITIIYSRWYGDIANERLAITMPIVGMFYTSLDGIAATKGYFVGVSIGADQQEKALLNDKRINMMTFIVAAIEGVVLAAFAFVLPLAWNTVSHDVQFDAGLILLITGLTYPAAALTKGLLGSFKVAGMGKIIILSNGLFALLFEFLVPLILYLVYLYGNLNIEFWELILISRIIKLFKLPPTLFFWKKKKWLIKAI